MLRELKSREGNTERLFNIFLTFYFHKHSNYTNDCDKNDLKIMMKRSDNLIKHRFLSREDRK